jgi:hypothetical protein
LYQEKSQFNGAIDGRIWEKSPSSLLKNIIKNKQVAENQIPFRMPAAGGMVF